MTKPESARTESERVREWESERVTAVFLIFLSLRPCALVSLFFYLFYAIRSSELEKEDLNAEFTDSLRLY